MQWRDFMLRCTNSFIILLLQFFGFSICISYSFLVIVAVTVIFNILNKNCYVFLFKRLFCTDNTEIMQTFPLKKGKSQTSRFAIGTDEGIAAYISQSSLSPSYRTFTMTSNWVEACSMLHYKHQTYKQYKTTIYLFTNIYLNITDIHIENSTKQCNNNTEILFHSKLLVFVLVFMC